MPADAAQFVADVQHHAAVEAVPLRPFRLDYQFGMLHDNVAPFPCLSSVVAENHGDS